MPRASRAGRLVTRTCLVCNTVFTQPTIKGTLRRMCTDACSKERTRQRHARDFCAYKERYAALRMHGASKAYAHWGSCAGQLRYEAALDVLLEEQAQSSAIQR